MTTAAQQVNVERIVPPMGIQRSDTDRVVDVLSGLHADVRDIRRQVRSIFLLLFSVAVISAAVAAVYILLLFLAPAPAGP